MALSVSRATPRPPSASAATPIPAIARAASGDLLQNGDAVSSVLPK
jgi:hypothetical protein